MYMSCTQQYQHQPACVMGMLIEFFSMLSGALEHEPSCQPFHLDSLENGKEGGHSVMLRQSLMCHRLSARGKAEDSCLGTGIDRELGKAAWSICGSLRLLNILSLPNPLGLRSLQAATSRASRSRPFLFAQSRMRS